MKDVQTPSLSAESTVERGNYIEKNLHLNMKENDLRGSAIPQGREMTGNVFAQQLWHPCFFPDYGEVCCIFICVIFFAVFFCFWFKHTVNGWRKVLYHIVISHQCAPVWNQKFNNVPPLCRSPLAPPLRSGYRERDFELRERERSGSRDRDEHYGRPGYDRPPYERAGLDRSVSERYSHSSSPYGMFSPNC